MDESQRHDTRSRIKTGIGVATELAILADDTIEHGPLECLFTVDEGTGVDRCICLERRFHER